jgi:predicted ABC-type ATPase
MAVMATKRLRIFAGPNGSGKSTIYKAVDKVVECRHFVNADLIEVELRKDGRLSFNDYIIDMKGREADFKSAFAASGLYVKTSDGDALLESISITSQNTLVISKPALVDSYFAAFVAEYLRFNMLNLVESFTIETVMSDPNKLEYIRTARKMGYRIYLYFVSTRNVSINIDRVGQRIELGGHSVPEDKIRSRYTRSLENLYQAMLLSDRAYIFDNSDTEWKLLGEWDGRQLEIQEISVPEWFVKYLIEKFPNT